MSKKTTTKKAAAKKTTKSTRAATKKAPARKRDGKLSALDAAAPVLTAATLPALERYHQNSVRK
jgi:hypothetical protein